MKTGCWKSLKSQQEFDEKQLFPNAMQPFSRLTNKQNLLSVFSGTDIKLKNILCKDRFTA